MMGSSNREALESSQIVKGYHMYCLHHMYPERFHSYHNIGQRFYPNVASSKSEQITKQNFVEGIQNTCKTKTSMR